ncbi:MAG: C1 family peptidase [Bacteroidales bacterium]|nr:C1 family peptidase [Bacteroidales bacterium]
MKNLLSIAFLSLCAAVSAQSIDNTQLEYFRKEVNSDPNLHLRQNSIIGDVKLRDKALNHDLKGKIDHFFKYKVDVKGITDQKSSGRCWMFTSMNVLRPSIMKKYNLSSFDFSQNYLYFYDLLEKSNLFLENIIKTSGKDINDREVVFYFSSPVGDGGVWNLFYNAASKYGFVPKEVMPETAHSENTSLLGSFLNERLRKGGYEIRELAQSGKKEKQLREAKQKTMTDIYKILTYTLGEPPTEFTWRYKTKDGEVKSLKTTPMEFYKENVPQNYSPEEFVMIMNDPTRPYYQVYDIDNYRNTIEGVNWKYLNLPNEDIKKSALASIKNNEAMYASCDVGKQNNREDGILDPEMYDYESLFGVNFDMDKKARILTRQSGSSHAMAVVAVDTDENDVPVKWEFENSWGSASGNNGYLTFTDKWFDEYLFRIVIRKEYLSQKALEALKTKPVSLPAWDYMF